MDIKWSRVRVEQGEAPWTATLGEMTLSVQPWYGDGINYRGIIQHENWTFTLKYRFTDLEVAKTAVGIAATSFLPIQKDS